MSDLQKNLVINIENSSPQSVAAALKQYLQSAEWELLGAVADIAADKSISLFLVGGRVRDFLLGIKGNFPDLAVEGDALKLAEKVSKKMGGSIVAHSNFKTATWELGKAREEIAKSLNVVSENLPEAIDFASARSESYDYAGALPDVKFADIRADLRRRDFTINALAIRLNGRHMGEITEIQDGANDLKTGQLRVLHEKSFEDDATRLLRILRFRGRLGFEIEKDTVESLNRNLKFIETISGKRLRHELDLALAEKNWSLILNEMEERGILKALHPGLTFTDKAKMGLASLEGLEIDRDWGISAFPLAWIRIALWLMHLDHVDAARVADRLNLESEIRIAILQAGEWMEKLEELTENSASGMTFILDGLSPLTRFVLFASSQNKMSRENIERYVKEWQHIQPKSTGTTLRKMGLKEGPKYAQILTALRASWLDGEVNSEEEEKQLLAKLLEREQN